MAQARDYRNVPGTSEEEPLLGAQGDASQPEGKPLYHNLIIGEWTFDELSWYGVCCIILTASRHWYSRAVWSMDRECTSKSFDTDV